MQCATGARAFDALSFSPDNSFGATKGARFKMFPFQAAVKHSSSLRGDSACPWAHLFAAIPETMLQSSPAASSPHPPHPRPTLTSRSIIGSKIELFR